MTDRVLVVERAAAHRAALAEALARRGHAAVAVSSRAAGLAALARGAFAAVVLCDAAAGARAERGARTICRAAGRARVLLATNDRLGDAALSRLTEGAGLSLVVYLPVTADALVEQVEALLATPAHAGAADLAHELAALRAGFAAALPERLEALAAALSSAAAAVDAHEPLALAVLLAHRLRGIAAPYGFTLVGELAGKIEDALAPDAAAGTTPAEGLFARCTAWLDEARALARGPAPEAQRVG